MLFYISETIVELAENDNKQVLAMLDNLYHSWGCGRCLVDGSRDSLRRLSAVDDKFSHILKTKQGISGIYGIIEFYIILLYGVQKDASPRRILKAKGCWLDYSTVSDERLFSINNLLCEHVDDAYVYKWGSQFYLPAVVRNIHLNIYEQLGGGHNIKDCAKNYYGKKQITLCILDSDKHHPKDRIGKTATDFLSEYQYFGAPFITYYILEAQEIENIIPFEVLKGCNLLTKKQIANHEKIDFLKPIANLFFKYWDTKKGFKPSDLRLVKKEYGYYFSDICNLLILLGVKQTTIDTEVKKTYDSGRDSALLSGYQGETLSDCSDYIKRNSEDVRLFKLDAYQKRDWDRISRLVWTIGCAANPKRV